MRAVSRSLVAPLLFAALVAGLPAGTSPRISAATSTCTIASDPLVARVVDIAPSAGGNSIANAVNASGAVVGYVFDNGQPQAFVWTEAEGARPITAGNALGINAAGVVVGHTAEPDLLSRPFRWTAAGGVKILGTLGGPSGAAYAINGRGEIVGTSQLAGGGGTHATLWRANGAVEDLGTLGGDAVATRITDQGIVAGWGRTQSGTIHAFVWTRGTGLRDLGAGAAWGLNAHGTVVGGLPSVPDTSYVWPWFGNRLSLGRGQARAITSFDVIVGGRQPTTDEEDTSATMWLPGRGERALGSLGGCRSLALDANDRGRIVGLSADATGMERATVWDVQFAVVTAVVHTDEQWHPMDPAPLARSAGVAGLGTGTATRVNETGEALLLDSIVPGSVNFAPTRTLLWRPPGDRVDLGGFGDIVVTRGTALNRFGDIVGEALSRRGFYEPFIWRPGSGLALLEPDPDRLVEQNPPTAINDRQEVAGGIGSSTAYRWDPGTGLLVRHPLGGACGSSARDVSPAGEVVGASTLLGQGCEDADPSHAYLWRRDGRVIDLGTLGGTRSEAIAINGRGQVTGWSQTADGSTHAFFWSAPTGMVDVGTLGGAWSRPVAINNRGEIAGTSLTTLGFLHGFVWSMRTRLIDLGADEPAAINDLGHAAGTNRKTDQAFFWAELGGHVTLNYRARAFDINDRAEVAGDRRVADQRSALLWRERATIGEVLEWYEVQASARLYDGTFSAADVTATRADTAAARIALFTGDDLQLTTRLDALARRFGIR